MFQRADALIRARHYTNRLISVTPLASDFGDDPQYGTKRCTRSRLVCIILASPEGPYATIVSAGHCAQARLEGEQTSQSCQISEIL